MLKFGPMIVFAAVMVVVGIVFAYVFVIDPERISSGRLLLVAAPFAAAFAAVGAVREEVADRMRQATDVRTRRREAKRDKIAPHEVEPVRPGPDDGPFRAAPRPAPIVVRRADTPAAATPVVAVDADAAPPKLLT